MHALLPLISDRAEVSAHGLRLVGFAVRRHATEPSGVELHRNRWSQLVFFLCGAGRQTVGAEEFDVEAGAVALVPPGVCRAFRRTSERVPLSLVIDFRLAGDESRAGILCRAEDADLMRLREAVGRLVRLGLTPCGAFQLEAVTIVLQILITLLRTAGWLERVQIAYSDEPSPAIHQLVSKLDPTVPLGNVVQRSGYTRDHLNRLVKRETGLTLGRLRSQKRLERAKALLVEGMQVGNVAATVGLPDQSYFARWFRRQTGDSPSRWMQTVTANRIFAA